MKRLLILVMSLLLVGVVYPQEDKNIEDLKVFLKEKLKVKNDGEIEKCMIKVRERVRQRAQEENDFEFLKESIKISYSNGLDLETAAEFAFELQNKVAEMIKYGFSNVEAKKICINTQNKVMTQEKTQIKKSSNNQSEKEKLMLQIRNRIEERLKERIKEKESSSKDGNKNQNRVKTQKKTDNKQK